MTRNQIVANTLRWCNRQRRKKGLRPLGRLPVGIRGDSRSCPCGAATRLHVFSTWAVETMTDANLGQTPASVQEFVRLFDNGELSEYDAAA